MQAAQSIDIRYFYLTSALFRQMPCHAEAVGKTLVLTLPFDCTKTPIEIITSAYEKMADERPHATTPTDIENTESKRSRRKVQSHVGEEFYRQQEKLLEGWELQTPAPRGLVTDDGIRTIKRKGGFKPDNEPQQYVKSADIWGL